MVKDKKISSNPKVDKTISEPQSRTDSLSLEVLIRFIQQMILLKFLKIVI
jgi:hypothetical protein